MSTPVDFLLEGREYKITSNTKSDTIIFKSKDRNATKVEIEAELKKKKIKYISEIVPGITRNIESIVIEAGNKKIILGFKPAGGGSGAGAEQTALGECAQAVYCAAAQLKKSVIQAPYVHENLNQIQKIVDIDINIKDVVNKLSDDWVVSSTKIANHLIKTLPKKTGYVFHRGSPEVDKINETFKRLNSKLDDPFSNINKWSPADIWAIQANFKPTYNFDSLDEFNQYLLKQFNLGNMLGISLKKVEKQEPHTDYFNVGEPRRAAKLDKIQLAAPGKTILGSKDMYLHVSNSEDSYKIQFRSFAAVTSWQSEIKGKTANLGKLAYGPVNKILAALNIKKLTDTNTVRNLATKKDAKLLGDMYDMYKDIADPGMTKIEFLQKAAAKDADFIFSKYLGTELAHRIHKSPKNKQNDFAAEVIGTALSNSANSAPFMKVS